MRRIRYEDCMRRLGESYIVLVSLYIALDEGNEILQALKLVDEKTNKEATKRKGNAVEEAVTDEPCPDLRAPIDRVDEFLNNNDGSAISVRLKLPQETKPFADILRHLAQYLNSDRTMSETRRGCLQNLLRKSQTLLYGLDKLDEKRSDSTEFWKGLAHVEEEKRHK